MKKMKIMTIVGTRPEIIKLSRVIAELEKYFNHILVHTGQNYDYELNKIFFDELEIKKPNYFLEIATGKSVAKDIANAIAYIDPILEKEKPDAVLFYGDTNSTLTAIAVKRRQIPIFHMEAGNRCFDYRVPEEINRKILDHISDINMVISEHARRYLLAEGIKPDTIFKTGSSLKEIYSYHKKNINSSEVLSQLKLTPKDYFVVSMHREDNVDNNLPVLIEALNKVAAVYKKPLIVSTHPRTHKRLSEVKIKPDKLIQFNKPFGFFDYVKLQQQAFCVLSDSGSITEEASILSFPAVTIRRMHERPEGMDVGTLIMSGFQSERILQAIEVVTSQDLSDIVTDYAVANVSQQVVRIIMSYVDYVNRIVWSK